MTISYLLALFTAALVTGGITPLVIIIAKKFGWVDDPKKRAHPANTHLGIIPRAGGLAIFAGIFFPLLFFINPTKQIIGIFAGAIILLLVGLWDDQKDRSPYIRFITNILAALCVIAAGIGIPYITNPLGGVIHLDQLRISINFLGTHSIWVFADAFALIWIVWMTNIVGWSGGVDGQLPGFVAISSTIIGLLSIRYTLQDPSQTQVSYLAFLTAGAFLGFLPWNFFPQKIMPGYGGKTLAGFMLAILSILAYGKLGTALLVLAVPITDAVFMMGRRMIAGKSPVWASSGHLHHHLLKLGWGKRRIAIFYWSISAITGIGALTLNSQQKVFATLVVLAIISGFIVWINILRRLKTPATED